LDGDLNDPNGDEAKVIQDVLEGIQAIRVDVSAVELIEEGHQNKGVEDEGVHLEPVGSMTLLVSEGIS
jgi:hypothetical protein